jgi:hypothetical protein
MRLTWRDAVGTLLIGAAVSVTLSVAHGWNWALIGDARAGTIALFVLSYPSCLVARAPGRMAAAMAHETPWSPFLVMATALGAAALALMIVDIVVNSIPLLVGTSIVVVAIWALTTVHHLVETGPRPSLHVGM